MTERSEARVPEAIQSTLLGYIYMTTFTILTLTDLATIRPIAAVVTQ